MSLLFKGYTLPPFTFIHSLGILSSLAYVAHSLPLSTCCMLPFRCSHQGFISLRSLPWASTFAHILTNPCILSSYEYLCRVQPACNIAQSLWEPTWVWWGTRLSAKVLYCFYFPRKVSLILLPKKHVKRWEMYKLTHGATQEDYTPMIHLGVPTLIRRKADAYSTWKEIARRNSPTLEERVKR